MQGLVLAQVPVQVQLQVLVLAELVALQSVWVEQY